MNWISVEDRLPDVSKSNTIGINIVNNSLSEPAYYTNMGDGEYAFHTDEGLEFTKVTHWSYLPEPPVDETEYGWTDKNGIISGIKGTKDQEIILNTQHGEVKLEAPTTPAKAVMALRSAIGMLEGYYPKDTPYPKTIHKEP